MKSTEQLVIDYMTKDVVTIDTEASLTEAICLMDLKCLAALPVIKSDGKICGILTTSDLVTLAYDLQCDVGVLPHVSGAVRQTLTDALADDNKSLKVTDVMTTEVVTVSDQTSIGDAAQILIDNACHHLPVVDDSNRVRGIISTFDIARTVANEN